MDNQDDITAGLQLLLEDQDAVTRKVGVALDMLFNTNKSTSPISKFSAPPAILNCQWLMNHMVHADSNYAGNYLEQYIYSIVGKRIEDVVNRAIEKRIALLRNEVSRMTKLDARKGWGPRK